MRLFVGIIHGISFLGAMTVGVAVAFFAFLPWEILGLVPIVAVHRLRRMYAAWINQIYFSFAAALLEDFCGIRVLIHCQDDSALRDTNFWIMSNHRTRVDWMFTAWSYAAHFRCYPLIIMILKDALKPLPFFGWCMQMLVYVFLSRDRSKDLPHMQRCVDYSSLFDPDPRSTKVENSVLSAPSSTWFIFPEGTDLSESNLEKNTTFALSKGLPVTKHVLYPKPAGVQFFSAVARRRQSALHDLTVAYVDHPKSKRTSEFDLLRGRFPREVHIFVDRFQSQSLPEDDALLKQWLVDRFAYKEQLLEAFYSQPRRVDRAAYPLTFTHASLPDSADLPGLQRRRRVWAPVLQLLLVAAFQLLCVWVWGRLWVWVGVLWALGSLGTSVWGAGLDRRELALSEALTQRDTQNLRKQH